MTTTTKAAGNGSKTATGQPERLAGTARAHEAATYHMATLVHDAVFEAERLAWQVYRAASDAHTEDRPSATAALTNPVMRGKIQEIRECLEIAQRSLFTLEDSLDGTPPF